MIRLWKATSDGLQEKDVVGPLSWVCRMLPVDWATVSLVTLAGIEFSSLSIPSKLYMSTKSLTFLANICLKTSSRAIAAKQVLPCPCPPTDRIIFSCR